MQTSINDKILHLFLFFIVSAMDDIPQGRRKSAIIFNLGRVFHSRSFVHFKKDKAVHRVNVHECLDKLIIRIWQYSMSQRSLKILNSLWQFEYIFPHIRKHHHVLSYLLVIVTIIGVFKLIYLGKNNSLENLLWRWKNWHSHVKVFVDHVMSRCKLVLVNTCSPVPGQPLKIFRIDKIKAVIALQILFLVFVSNLSIWSFSFEIVSSFYILFYKWAVICLLLNYHLIEIHRMDFWINHYFQI